MTILFLTHRLPYAPNRGDRIRAYHLVRALAATGDVDLVSLVHDDEEAAHAGDLNGVCRSTTTVRVPRLMNHLRGGLRLLGSRPLTHSLLASPEMPEALTRVVSRHPPDVVVAYCSGMAQYAVAPPLNGVPFVLDLVDVDSEKWRSLASTAGPLARWVYRREHRTLRAFEAIAATAAVSTLVVNEREHELLAGLAPRAHAVVVPNGVDVEFFRPVAPPSPSATVVFTGVMDYAPNVEAAVWMAREVWPRVRAVRPDARFEIVGSNPTAAVQALAAPGIVVTGQVPDTRPHLWGAGVSVAPLETARGIQNKVLEALAAGTPAVVTSVVASGLPGEVLSAIDIADGPEAFARAVLTRLADSPAARRARASTARLDGLSWPVRLGALPQLLREAAGRTR